MVTSTESQADSSLTARSVAWVDWPHQGWLASKWDLTHSIGCAFAFFLYLVPGLVFLVAKSVASERYQARLWEAEAARSAAFRRTGCVWLASVLHLGGHPFLPYRERVVLGLTEDSLVFYDYGLNVLHSVPLKEVHGNWEARHVTSTSFGAACVPKGSSFGTTTSTQHVDVHPDMLQFSMPINGQFVTAEFDCRPDVDPLEFGQTLNELLVG